MRLLLRNLTYLVDNGQNKLWWENSDNCLIQSEGGPVHFNGKILTDASTNMYTAYQVILRVARRFECDWHFVRRLSFQDGRPGGASHWKSLSHPMRRPFLPFLSSRNRGITVTLQSYRSVACKTIRNEENSVNNLFVLCQIGQTAEAWVGYMTLSLELTAVYVQHRVLTFHLWWSSGLSHF